MRLFRSRVDEICGSTCRYESYRHADPQTHHTTAHFLVNGVTDVAKIFDCSVLYYFVDCQAKTELSRLLPLFKSLCASLSTILRKLSNIMFTKMYGNFHYLFSTKLAMSGPA